MRFIALEGYLRERPEIRTDWFTKASRGLSPVVRARVAVRFLKEGEISCAEFVKLVYEDITLCPIETVKEYTVELSADAAGAPMVYLLKIAQQSLTERHIPKLLALQEEIEKLDAEKDSTTYQKKAREMFDYILAADPWAQDKAKKIQDVDVIKTMSGEQHVALIEEIVSRAKNLSIEIEPEEKLAMGDYVAFWRGRVLASKTMVSSTQEIAGRQDVLLVAMVIGAAHTEGICDVLKKGGYSFAVITPSSFGNEEDMANITWEMLERKYKRLSIYYEGFTKGFLKAFPSSEQKKPEPVLSEPWFQGKAELYLFTERIARHVLGPPSPPGDGKAPFDFTGDEFSGKWVHIDPKTIILIPASEEEVKTVLFPAILNLSDPIRRTETWVKAGLNVPIVPAQEQESVETMLRKALSEVKSTKVGTAVEDAAGRIQITLNTVAGYAHTRQAAAAIHIGR